MGSDEEWDEGKPPKRASKRMKLIEELTNKEQIEALLEQRRPDYVFSIPPCEVKEPEFRARYGLVDIVNRMPSYDAFRSVEMSKDALLRVHDLVANDVVYSLAFQAGDDGEMQITPILDRMLRNIGRFTRPRPRMELEQAYGQGVNSKKADFAVKYDEADEEVHPTDEIELPNSQSSDSSTEVLALKPFSSASTSPRHHADAKMYVYTDRYTISGLRLKAIADWKSKAAIANLFQPATYAIQEMQDPVAVPLDKCYRPPVYIFACDKSYWYYGILEIDGFVKVAKQQISSDYLSVKDVNLKKFTPSYTRADVEGKMLKWKQTLDVQGLKVPNGVHPVGRFFVRAVQGYEMLTVGTDAGEAQQRFLNGLLKILVGRRVNKWTPEDATQAWNARQYLERHR